MAENSGISWTDNTFNPWMGCTKVSPACKNCYAERDMDYRHGKVAWGPNGTRVLTSDQNWQKPVKWNREAEKSGKRLRVFCASLADVFEDWQGPIYDHKGNRLFWSHSREPHQSRWHWVPESATAGGEMPVIMDDVRRRLFELIDNTPHLDWLLLTKRPQNIMGLCMWPVHPSGIHQEGMSFIESHRRNNVWLGTSVESQEYADKRIPELLKCRDLSPVLFLSCEPLVGPLDLEYPESLFPKGPPMCCDGRECGCMGLPCEPPAYLYQGIDWLITGGESGPEARPNHLAWFRSLRDQAERNHIPFHFKQWGEWGPESTATPAQINNASYEVCENGERLYRVGKKAAGRMLDGVEHNAFPESKI